MHNRRAFVKGLSAVLAAGVAPAIVTRPMKLWVPRSDIEPDEPFSFWLTGNSETNRWALQPGIYTIPVRIHDQFRTWDDEVRLEVQATTDNKALTFY